MSKNTEKGDGGAKGIRTPDLYTASVALSQLSYGPVRNIRPDFSGFFPGRLFFVIVDAGLDPDADIVIFAEV